MPALLLMLLLVTSPAWGATYYVDGTGGSDSTGNGSIGNPWATIRKAVTTGTPVVACDTVIVKNATYTPASGGTVVTISSTQGSPSGTSTCPITIKSENPLGAVIQMGATTSSNAGFDVNRPYYIIEGFDINGGTMSGNQSSSSLVFTGIAVRTGATGFIARKNKIHDIARNVCSNSTNGFSAIFVQGPTAASGVRLEKNVFHTIGRLFNAEVGPGGACTTTLFQNDHAIYLEHGNNVTVLRNLCYKVDRGFCINLYNSGDPTTFTHTNVDIAHNTFDHPSGETRGPCGKIIYGQTQVGLKIRNNIFSNPEVSALQTTGVGTMTNVSMVGNRMNVSDANFHCGAVPTGITVGGTNVSGATLGFANLGSNDYTLTSTSTAIDTGSDIGLPYNGSAPDAGAFETFTFASCAVPSGATSTIQITFTNNANPPISSTITTFTARRNGASNALTGAATKIGDNIASLPVTTAYSAGNTADISWSSGALTDQALIGSTLNQPFIQTLANQSCSNSAAAHTFTQATYRFHGVYGLEASPDIRSAENVAAFSVVKNGGLRTRFALTCGGADCPPTGFYLYYSTGGAYAAVPDDFTADNVAFCGSSYSGPLIPVNGSATTAQLSTSGTFAVGGVIYTSNAIPTVSGLNNGYKTELEYCVKFDADATGTYTFRVRQQDGTVLNTYTVTPTITIVPAQASAGY
jgi:hypothetical protein